MEIRPWGVICRNFCSRWTPQQGGPKPLASWLAEIQASSVVSEGLVAKGSQFVVFRSSSLLFIVKHEFRIGLCF